MRAFSLHAEALMGAKQSAETAYAIRLHTEDRKPIAESARVAGIRRSTLQRALERMRQRVKKKA